MRSLVVPTLGLTLLLAFAQAARADSIDGNWCRVDGRHVEVRGSEIATPGGNFVTGSYSRHAFSYIIPTGEEGAGNDVQMHLISEDAVRVTVAGGTTEVWRRCRPAVS